MRVVKLTESQWMACVAMLTTIVTDPKYPDVHIDVVRQVETTPLQVLGVVAGADYEKEPS